MVETHKPRDSNQLVANPDRILTDKIVLANINNLILFCAPSHIWYKKSVGVSLFIRIFLFANEHLSWISTNNIQCDIVEKLKLVL